MFFGEEYNVPPCCDQKYFRFLWEELDKNQTTTLFLLSDYSLQQVLGKVMLRVPMSTMSMLVPELSDTLLDQLVSALTRHWYNGKDNTAYHLERLNLLLPESIITDELKQSLATVLAPFGDRVTVSQTLESPQTIIHIKNQHKQYVFTGTTRQHTDTKGKTLNTLIASQDPRVCKETETVLRLHGRKKLKTWQHP